MKLYQGARALNPFNWMVAPALACMTATVLFSAPLRAWGLQLPEPVFGLACAFAWPIIRPSVIAPFLLLALGLFTDLYTGAPTGLWALGFLAVYAVVLSARSLMGGQGWAARGLWFAVSVALAMGVGVFLTVLYDLQAPAPLAMFWQFLATCALYPFVDRLIERFEDVDPRYR